MPKAYENAVKVLSTALAISIGYLTDFVVAQEIEDGTYTVGSNEEAEHRFELYMMLGDSITNQAVEAVGLTDNEKSSLEEYIEILFSEQIGVNHNDESEVRDN